MMNDSEDENIEFTEEQIEEILEKVDEVNNLNEEDM
jgi:hypothetical protein